MEIWGTLRHFKGSESHFFGLLVVKLTLQNTTPFGIRFLTKS